MKFHSAAIASVSVLAPLSAAWNVAIYDSLDQECNEEYMRYYLVEGEGSFDFAPWKGPPWGGYIHSCSYYFDGGSQGPFICDGPNPDFVPRRIVIRDGEGWCTIKYADGNKYMETNHCFDFTDSNLGEFESINCFEMPTKECLKNPDGDGCPTNQNGRTVIDVSDEAMNFGYAHPRDAFKKLLHTCTNVGCHGDNKAEIKTSLIHHRWPREFYNKISAEASFAGRGAATRENMIQLIQAVADQTTETRTWKWRNPRDRFDVVEINDFWFPQEIDVRVELNGTSSHLNVRTELAEADMDSGACETTFAALGAVAGALNGVAGGVFGLAGLQCH